MTREFITYCFKLLLIDILTHCIQVREREHCYIFLKSGWFDSIYTLIMHVSISKTNWDPVINYMMMIIDKNIRPTLFL